jgi:hypothetical protein
MRAVTEGYRPSYTNKLLLAVCHKKFIPSSLWKSKSNIGVYPQAEEKNAAIAILGQSPPLTFVKLVAFCYAGII